MGLNVAERVRLNHGKCDDEISETLGLVGIRKAERQGRGGNG